MDVSREQNRPAKSGQCHSGYQGTQCQTRKCLEDFENYVYTFFFFLTNCIMSPCYLILTG